MAGPGGGPPRRSHTKSRKGCEMCKRRHIRCDENFPQCRNCTKHKIRCPYNDMPPTDERSASEEKPNMFSTPEVMAAIERWQEAKDFPFNLNISQVPDPHLLGLDGEQRRLIYHVAEITSHLDSTHSNGLTLWTRHIPLIIQIGADPSHGYVLDALLSFSAMHMTFEQECPLTGSMVYKYRGQALAGLRPAISSFSRESADAVLAASLVLSWQATDWPSWKNHMLGTSSVIQAIVNGGWSAASEFSGFIAESRTFPTASRPSPADYEPSHPREEDLSALEETYGQLRAVESHLTRLGEDTTQFAELIDFLKGVRKATSGLSLAQQFDRLQPLRTWGLFMPVHYLWRKGPTPSYLLFIAHYYAVALLMERLFPEIGAAYFGSLTMGPLRAINDRLLHFSASAAFAQDAGLDMVSSTLAYMEFPMRMLESFRLRHSLYPTQGSWPPPPLGVSMSDDDVFEPGPPLMEMPTVTSGFFPTYAATPEFSYSLENLPGMTNTATPYSSYSTDNLSVDTHVSGPNTAISPLQQSPFSSQLLGIPSPYGVHSPSPTSSTYGGSDMEAPSSVGYAYSDHDEYMPDSACFYGNTALLGGPSSNYGIEFVPQFPINAQLA